MQFLSYDWLDTFLLPDFQIAGNELEPSMTKNTASGLYAGIDLGYDTSSILHWMRLTGL